METVLISLSPFMLGLLIWIVKSIFGHKHRISSSETKIADLEEIKINTMLTNHEARIFENEKNIDSLNQMHNSYNDKFNQLIWGVARIEGSLNGKKDKE